MAFSEYMNFNTLLTEYRLNKEQIFKCVYCMEMKVSVSTYVLEPKNKQPQSLAKGTLNSVKSSKPIICNSLQIKHQVDL